MPTVVLLPLPGIRAAERVEVRMADRRRRGALDRAIRTMVVRFLPTVRARRSPEARGRRGQGLQAGGDLETGLLRDRILDDRDHASPPEPGEREPPRGVRPSPVRGVRTPGGLGGSDLGPHSDRGY